MKLMIKPDAGVVPLLAGIARAKKSAVKDAVNDAQVARAEACAFPRGPYRPRTRCLALCSGLHSAQESVRS